MSNVIILILVYLLQNAHGKCLNSNSDIHQAMISTTVEPSLENITWKDNYYNISTALFPLPSHWSERSHALYIRVWVHFLNASNTGIDFSKTLKFTWSESCIYVVIEPVATTILSHGTIVLQRATTSLHITLPPFCSKVNEGAVKERMLSFITKLQDLAISPNVSDPRLNTASCILHGHDNDRLELSTWQKGLYGYLANSPAVASFLATPFLLTQMKVINKEKNKNKETEDKTVLNTLMLLSAVIPGLLNFGAFVKCIYNLWDKNSLISYWSFLIAYGLLLFFSICKKCKTRCKEGYCTALENYGIFSVVHSAIWMVIGIISDYNWAVLVVLFVLLFYILFYFIFYMLVKKCKVADNLEQISFLICNFVFLPIIFITCLENLNNIITFAITILSGAAIWILKKTRLGELLKIKTAQDATDTQIKKENSSQN